MTTYEKLERLHNYPTRYELIAERGEQRILIAYSMRTGRHSLLTCCQKHGQKMIDFMGVSETDTFTFLKPAALGAVVAGWKIKFSGRTQRDAISNGELPFIGSLEVAQ